MLVQIPWHAIDAKLKGFVPENGSLPDLTINKGRFTMTALPDFTPLQGGAPIIHEGQAIGAIGVSGAKSAQQDEEVAKASAAVLQQK